MISQSEVRLLEMKLSKAERRADALEAKLAPYLAREEEEQKAARKQERVELISETLFPTYSTVSVRYGHTKAPPNYPGLGWWNGATIEWWGENIDGSIELEVKSYVGGDNFEQHKCTLPAAWMTADDPKPLILEWIEKETNRLADSEKKAEIAKAKQEIKAATAALAKLCDH